MRNHLLLVWLIGSSLFVGCQSKAPDQEEKLSVEVVREIISVQTDPFGEILSEYESFDLLIQGGLIIDGSGQKGFLGDILIVKDRIVYVGPTDERKIQVNKRIDAAGKIVSPGFIDAHAHGDPVRQPAFRNFLSMGVTTIVLGQDGRSTPRRDLAPWMREVEYKRPGPNIATFVGHGTLREMSGVGFKRDPGNGLEKMKQQLANGLEAGAWGMTTGLEYTPGMYAGEEELQALAKVVGEHGGMIMSHIRNEDDDQLIASLDELLRQGTHCPVHVSHMKSVYGKGPERAEQILIRLAEARQTGIQVTADIYPYAASFTGIGIVFPSWARPPHNYSEVRRLKQAQLENYLRERVIKRNGPESTLFGTAPYAGKTLAQVAQEKGKPFEKVLMEDIGPRGASAAYFVMDEVLQQHLLRDSSVMVGSDGSPSMRHPRGYGSFAKIIETYVRQEGLFTLEEAIWKMTSLPARTIGFENRGRIAPDYFADLLIFQTEEIRATASFPNPHRLAEGFDYIIVNGNIAKEGAKWSSFRSGKMLKKPVRL
ncbi:MAG: amidohydrolase family protein [Bacteroidota bacterium]